MNHAATPSPFQGLQPFPEDRAAYFFGRESDIALVADNARAHPLTVLFGPSGVGKSSLLHAGVIPHVRAENASRLESFGQIETVVASCSNWRDEPLQALSQAIEKAFVADLGVALPRREDGYLDLAALHRLCETREVDLLLVLDQFDELFTYGADRVRLVARFLAPLVRRGARSTVLLAIREDALARLDEMVPELPSVFDNPLRLDHLDEASARAAVLGPLDRFNDEHPEVAWQVEPELLDDLLRQVRTGRVQVDWAAGGAVAADNSADVHVEAAFLQLVLLRLWDSEVSAASTVLRASTLRDLGGAEQIVRQHLDRVVRGFEESDLDVLCDVFGFLVTPSGTKIAHSATDLADLADRDHDDTRRLLLSLSSGDRRILRDLPPALDLPGAEPRYEIFHDILALAVRDWRTRRVAQRREVEAQQLLVAEREAAEGQERVTRRRLRRTRAALAAMAVLMALVIVLSLLTVRSLRDADRQREESRRAAALASMKVLLPVDPSAALEAGLSAWSEDNGQDYEEAFRLAISGSDLKLSVDVDGELMASGFFDGGVYAVTTDGEIHIWRQASGATDGGYTTERVSVPVGDLGVGYALLGGDRTHLLVNYVLETPKRSYEHMVDVNLQSGAITALRSAAMRGFYDVHVVEEGPYALLVGTPTVVWDFTRQQVVPLPRFPGVDSFSNGYALGGSGKTLGLVTTHGSRGLFRTYDIATGEITARVTFDVDGSGVLGTLEVDGTDDQFLVEGGPDLQSLWDPREQTLTRVANGWSTDNGMQGSASGVVTSLFYDEVLFRDRGGSLRGVKFDTVIGDLALAHGRQRVIAVGLDDGSAGLYLVDGGALLLDLPGHRAAVVDVALAPDDSQVLTASSDGKVFVRRMPAGTRTTVGSDARSVADLHVTGDGSWFVRDVDWGRIFSEPGRAFANDCTGHLIRSHQAEGSSSSTCFDYGFEPPDDVWDISMDGRTLVRGFDGAVFLGPSGNVRRLSTPRGSNVLRADPTNAAEIIVVATSARDAAVVRWDVRSDVKVTSVALSDEFRDRSNGNTVEGFVARLDVSSNGVYAAALTFDGIAAVVDTATMREPQVVDVGAAFVARVVSDGSELVTTEGVDGTVKVWDPARPGEPVRTMTVDATLTDVVLSADGDNALIAAGSADGRVYVWERATGKLLFAQHAISGAVDSLVFDPSATDTIVSVGDDGLVATTVCDLCSVDASDLEDLARARLPQRLSD